MISRRLLRLKIMHILYAYFNDENSSIDKYEKELFFSINKSYELYHYLFLLILDVHKIANEKIETAQNKRVPTQEDLNPNTRFVDNKIINLISKNISLNNYLSKQKISWINNPELPKRIYNEMLKSTFYVEYMGSKEDSFSSDKQLVIDFYTHIVANSDLLFQILEEKSIYWNDEVEFIINMVLKTIQKMQKHSDEYLSFLPLFKNEEDRSFAKRLFRKAIVSSDESIKLIEKHSENWKLDRIAFLDIIIMKMAIAEVMEFPSIPIKVSLNEYIEIVKYYSTNKSSIFINGVLDNIIQSLKTENKIVKSGRGLLEK